MYAYKNRFTTVYSLTKNENNHNEVVGSVTANARNSDSKLVG